MRARAGFKNFTCAHSLQVAIAVDSDDKVNTNPKSIRFGPLMISQTEITGPRGRAGAGSCIASGDSCSTDSRYSAP